MEDPVDDLPTSHAPESMEDTESDIDASSEEEENPSSTHLAELFRSALGGGSSDHLDDAGLLEAFANEFGKDTPDMSRAQLTEWVLQQYAKAEVRYYPEEVKSQVRLLELVVYQPLPDLAVEIWSSHA